MNGIFKFVLMLWATITLASGFSQVQVPNGNLEVWVGNRPQNWNTSNDLTQIPFVGFQSVFRSTEAYQGQFAARIRTGTLLGNTVPGYITIGVLNVNIQAPEQSTITGGHPFTSRPLLLRGHYKYSTSANDTGLGAVILWKYNPQSGQRDTIAAGGGFFTPQEQYVQFSMPIVYLSNQDPDTLNTLFMSSNFETITSGSTLFVDSLHFVYGQVSYIDLGPDAYLCPGKSITLDAGPGFQSYNWVSIDGLEPIGQGQQLVVTKPGRYAVVALDSEGLPVSGSIRIFGAPSPWVFNVGGGGPFAPPASGSEVILSGSQTGTRYRLLRNELHVMEIPGTGSAISFGLQPEGAYSVKAINTDQHQCEMMMMGSVIVTNATAINETVDAEGLIIFPNPGRDVFTIDTGFRDSSGWFAVFGLDGKTTTKGEIEAFGKGKFTISLPAEAKPGVYFIKVGLSNGSVLSGKFVVAR